MGRYSPTSSWHSAVNLRAYFRMEGIIDDVKVLIRQRHHMQGLHLISKALAAEIPVTAVAIR